MDPTSSSDSGYNVVGDFFSTLRTYYQSEASAKAAAPAFQQGTPLGVNQYGQPYVAGKASSILTSSPALLVGAGILAIGLIVVLAKS